MDADGANRCSQIDPLIIMVSIVSVCGTEQNLPGKNRELESILINKALTGF
jgi:hypothetical protein